VRTAAQNPLRRLHDDVDHEGTATEAHLGLLAVEVGDGLLDLADRAGPDTAPRVQHAVHCGGTQAGLGGDLSDPVRVLHAVHDERFLRCSQGSLMVFGGLA
jgi:hypothetical protein